MARYRRRKNHSGLFIFVALVATAGVGWWWLDSPIEPEEAVAVAAPKPWLTSHRPESDRDPSQPSTVAEKGGQDRNAKRNDPPSEVKPAQAKSLVQAGRDALAAGDLLAARAHFSDALRHPLPQADVAFLRSELTRIGRETIFSKRILDDDPWVQRYIIKAGDSLAKIGSQYKITDDLLASINGIKNKNIIRIGQSLKVIRGPFRAVIHKKTYTLDVFLGQTLVSHFKVGLGEDGSTPRGEWTVSTKLKNPTYYPPRGGKIVAADDPENPLGERWIGLLGTGGEAVGQLRYGIHGTIEPDSIGRDASLGCVRMFNEDVHLLYEYLIEKHSTVTIQ